MSKKLIYADHAATTPLCDAAWEGMVPFLREGYGNPSSLHSWAKKPRKAVNAAREAIAECIGADPDEIFFTSGGAESDNWAIKTFGHRRVVTSAFEHHAVLNSCLAVAKTGSQVGYVGVGCDGYVSPCEVAKACWCGEKGLVSIMLANNELGTIQDIGTIVSMVGRDEWVVHTDAVQAVGHIHINVGRMGVDLLSASAHKFNGPKGIGFLYCSKRVQRKRAFTSYLDGGQQELGRRAGTENVASIVGMAAALKWNCEHLKENTKRLRGLGRLLWDGLKSLHVPMTLNSKATHCLPGFVSVSFPGRSGEGLLHLLDLKGIAVSTGAACDSQNTQVSHVLRAIDMDRRTALGTLRISLGVENTPEDVELIVAALRKLI